MVIVDTSVWIPFFSEPASREKHEIDALIDVDRLVLVGVVLAELIQGCRTPAEANTVVSKLSGLRFLDTGFATWRRAGEISFSLSRKGVTSRSLASFSTDLPALASGVSNCVATPPRG